MQNLINLQKKITELKIDYFLLPSNDEFFNEFVPSQSQKLKFVTSFTGSNGFAIISSNYLFFFTDGRYISQGEIELAKFFNRDNKKYKVFNLSKINPFIWLLKNASKNSVTLFDSKLHSYNEILKFTDLFTKNNLKLLPTYKELVKINFNPVNKKVFSYGKLYTNNRNTKIAKLIKLIEGDILFLNYPPSICWLLNIRSSDLEHSPVLLCYALIHKNGKVVLFCNKKNKEFEQEILEEIKIYDFSEIGNYVNSTSDNIIFQIDGNYFNYELYSLIQKHQIINKDDPTLALKAVKSEIEVSNMIKANEIDGLSVTKFLFWIDSFKDKSELDEILLSNKILEFRKKNINFLYPSFSTISAFAENGSIIHYSPSKDSNKILNTNSIYLIDSGGQYLYGTTDITRSIIIGMATSDQINDFTRVLKGHIAIARAKFPKFTYGHQLDAIARYYLWQDFKDYEHGTSHGVGNFLSVHDDIPSISRKHQDVPLQKNMILSNEPGFYKKNHYGIRIENLILVEEADDDKFLQFKTISLAPIDYKLINFKMLTYPEKKWLSNYHKKILCRYKNYLDKNETIWMQNVLEIYNNSI